MKHAARTAAAAIVFSCWSTVAHAEIQPYKAETVKPYMAESVAPRNADSVKVETITYSDGAKYSGETLNGKMHGKGILYYADGTVYDGTFSSGYPEGKGVTVWANGTKYSGSFKRGLPEGEGVQTWPDGSKYSGQFKSGTIEGNGTIVTKDGSYTGPFKVGVMHGKGIATVSGKRYEVTYENGKLISSVSPDALPSASTGTSVQPYKAEEVNPHKAEEVKPYKAEEVKPYKAEEVKPYKAEEVKPYTAYPIVFQLDSVNAYYWLNQIDLPAPLTLIDNAVMIPLDIVVDKLGATAQWNDTWDEVTVTFYNNQVAVLKIGESAAAVNVNSLAMAAAPTVIDNYIYIPLHLLSDVADQEIYYMWETGQISLNIPPSYIPDFIENSTPGNYSYQPVPAPNSSATDNSNGDGASSSKPLFDLKDGLQWQEGFWNYSNMFPNWGSLFNP
jgi:hypothetical protein